MHGQGSFTWPDGRKYEGAYNMDLKHGYGTFRWADGSIYKGFFVQGKQHGAGELINRDGSHTTGIWKCGKLVLKKDEPSQVPDVYNQDSQS